MATQALVAASEENSQAARQKIEPVRDLDGSPCCEKELAGRPKDVIGFASASAEQKPKSRNLIFCRERRHLADAVFVSFRKTSGILASASTKRVDIRCITFG